jgi:hypothetical protein
MYPPVVAADANGLILFRVSQMARRVISPRYQTRSLSGPSGMVALIAGSTQSRMTPADLAAARLLVRSRAKRKFGGNVNAFTFHLTAACYTIGAAVT